MKNIYIKIISMFIIIAITLGTTYSCVFAAKNSNYFYYNQSAYTKALKGSELAVDDTTATADGDVITFEAGQKATYKVNLPFNTFRMTVKYAAEENTTLTIKASKPNESRLYTAATATLTSGATSTTINLGWTVSEGERTVEITSSGACTVSSIYFVKKYEYNIGPITYDMEAEYIADKNDVMLEGDALKFLSGGYVEYDFYLPFNAISADITYTSEADGILAITTDDGTENSASLTAGEGTVTAEFDITERKGERIMRVTSDVGCEISKITLNKEKITLVQDNLYLCNLTENEEAIQTAILLDAKASILMVNGSRRYINNDDPKEICENFNGRVYLPAHTLARAFGMYIEDMPDRDYLLIRSEKMEFAFCGDISYKEVFGGEKQTIENVVKYKNGKAYLPLRYFAEEVGKTVGYKDGIVAIDDKFSVANILNDNTVFSYVKEQFAPFYPEDKEGNTYYVAQNGGSDSYGGSSARPFKTLEAAASVAGAGDTIIVREGEYREILDLNDVSGTETAPVIFKAEGDNVYLSATEKVSGFEEYKEADSGEMIYRAQLPETWEDLGDGRNQVFFDKKAMVEARYPDAPVIDMGDDNEPLSYLWPVKGDLKSVKTEDGLYKRRVESETLLNQEAGYWEGATYVAMRGNGFYLQTAKIAESGNGYMLTEENPGSWDTGKPIYQNYGFLSGHMNALSTNEEWFIQDGYLYIIPPEGATVDDLNSKVEVKARQLVADMAESKFVRLDGFNTIGGSIRMNDSEMCTLANMNMKYINHFVYNRDQGRGFLTMDKGEYNEETGEYEYSHAHLNPNGEPPRGEVGIYIGGTDNIVINNEIDSAAGAAIYGVGCYTYIENNTIHDCGYAGSYVAGLFFTQERWESTDKKLGGNFIYQNTIYNAGRAVMQHTQADGYSSLRPYLPEEIAYNDFHDGILTTQDTGITYEYWISMGHEKLFTKMHHNLVYMKTAHENPYSFGIYHDGGTMNIDTYANIIFATAPNFGYTHDKVYNQDYALAYAHCPEWNNVQLSESVVGGRDGLTAADFPNQKPFYAGAYGEEEYLVNYNKISQNKEYDTPGIYYASDAGIGDGAVIENNAAILDAGEYIIFENVDFGAYESNEINIEFYGNEFNTGDAIEIIIGDTIDTGTVYAGTLTATSHDRDDINIFTVRTEILTEKTNVFVRMKSPKSARIYALRLGRDHIENAKLKAGLVYGGMFTSQDNSVLVKYRTDEGKIIPIAWNTLTGSTLTYKNVNFSTDVTKFIAKYSGNTNRAIEIKVDGVSVGTLDVSGGSGCLTNSTTLSSKISTGTHTVSVTFTGSGYTTDFYWFKFE